MSCVSTSRIDDDEWRGTAHLSDSVDLLANGPAEIEYMSEHPHVVFDREDGNHFPPYPLPLLTFGQWQLLKLGYLPAEMEQHWFMFYETSATGEHSFHICRSWSKESAYRLTIVPRGLHFAVSRAVCDRNSAGYQAADHEATMLWPKLSQAKRECATLRWLIVKTLTTGRFKSESDSN